MRAPKQTVQTTPVFSSPSPSAATPSTSTSTSWAASRAASKPPRVLACLQCQNRKVKCDRKFPCANCVKVSAHCVPGTLASRPRRRRFPERELLERLRCYEGLLRQNNIRFEPLHASSTDETANLRGSERGSDFPNEAHSGIPAPRADQLPRDSDSTVVKSKPEYEAKNLWHAMNQKRPTPEHDDHEDDSSDDDDDYDDDYKSSIPPGGSREIVVSQTAVRKAWDQLYDTNDHLLFGSRKSDVDLSTLHPDQIQIFRLWQIYLENVNPLLKVTHTPTLQPSIIDAASNVASIRPALEALMFSIYCVAILSLDKDDCLGLFGEQRKDLLARYRFGCYQALLECRVFGSASRDSLTALYLYLLSVRPDTDARSLSLMLGVALRIAQRMGLSNESTYAKCTALEAEMRRRLWWSLVMFDNRISEVSDHKATMLVPTWDCRTPLNVNDFDFQPEMKIAPAAHSMLTEALFVVVRSELSDFIRHSAFHLDFTNPCLKAIAKSTAQHDLAPEAGKLAALEKMIEDKYLQFCNTENPLHFMTLWTTRGFLAKSRILEHYSRFSRSPAEQMPEAQRNAVTSNALSILDCDTKLMSSPLTKGYHWLVQFQFPFSAYIHLVQDLKKWPLGEQAQKIWDAMSDNFDARSSNWDQQDDSPFLKVFAKVIFQAWAALEVAVSRQNHQGYQLELQTPRIVSGIKCKLMRNTPSSTSAQNNNSSNSSTNSDSIEQHQTNGNIDVGDMNFEDFLMPTATPMDLGGYGYGFGYGGYSLPFDRAVGEGQEQATTMVGTASSNTQPDLISTTTGAQGCW